MIQISLTTALGVYSVVLFILFFGIWIYTEVAVRYVHRRLAKQYLWRCVFCGYAYLDEQAEKLSLCPRCNSYNSVEDKFAREIPLPFAIEEKPDNNLEDRKNSSHRKRPRQKRRGPRRRR